MKMDGGDVALILREGGSIDLIYKEMKTKGETVEYWLSEQFILMMAIKWSLDNTKWRDGVTRKAKKKLEVMLAEKLEVT